MSSSEQRTKLHDKVHALAAKAQTSDMHIPAGSKSLAAEPELQEILLAPVNGHKKLLRQAKTDARDIICNGILLQVNGRRPAGVHICWQG